MSGPRETARPAPEGPAAGDTEKLDLAALAARLAARSAESAAAETAPDEDAPKTSAAADESGEEGAAPEVKVAEPQLSGAEVFAAVEGLLFAADHPLTAAQLARALPAGVGVRGVRQQLQAIAESLADSERGYELREIAGGWQLLTREKYAPYVARLRRSATARKLSGSALETLAVVAYKQPVGRAEIERIRGVNCGEMLRSLLDKRLVRIAGRSPELGNALLYATTQEFLEHFALASIGDLPRSAELGRRPPSKPAPAAAASDQSDPSDTSDKSDAAPGPALPPEAS